MNIYYVRHGQTDWNKERIIQGRTNIELNETGRSQAEETRKILLNEKIDLIICSPLDRAVETANIINRDRNIKIIKDEGFIERNFGKYEAKERSLVPFDDMWDYNKNIDMGSGERIRDLLLRVKNSLENVINTYYPKNVLIVAHGGVGVAVKCFFEGTPEDISYSKMEVKNCEVLKYEVKRG